MIPHIGQRAARDLRAGTGIIPAKGVGFMAHGERHQFVPGRMKLDPIDAIAEAVVGPQFRELTIGLACEFLDVSRADHLPCIPQFLLGPLCIEGPHNAL